MTHEFTDRYGGNPPSSLRICRGPCEGMGYYPDMDNWLENYRTIEDVAFLECPDCGGTGRTSWIETTLRIPGWLIGGIRFVFMGPARGQRNRLLDYWLRFKASFLMDLGGL